MMEDIRKDMFKTFDALLDKFASVGIRYEYSKEYECFLVSIDVSSLNDSDLEDFSGVFLSNIEALQDKYGEAAPLFCMNAEWFALSPEAKSYSPVIEKDPRSDFEWANANVYRSIVRMRQLLYPTASSRVSYH